MCLFVTSGVDPRRSAVTFDPGKLQRHGRGAAHAGHTSAHWSQSRAVPECPSLLSEVNAVNIPPSAKIWKNDLCSCVPSSSSISKHWEAELEALKGNNAKLTAALLESTANVKQWKQQLAAYQEEAERLHKRVQQRATLAGGGISSGLQGSFRLCFRWRSWSVWAAKRRWSNPKRRNSI